jgi:hypothetical protein
MKKKMSFKALGREDLKKIQGGGTSEAPFKCNPGCSATNLNCGNWRCSCYLDASGATGICSTIPIGN